MLLPGEHIESSHQALSENLEQLPFVHSREQQSEKSEQKRLWQSGKKRRENFPGILALWSRLRVKSPLYWATWACAALVILSLTVISQTDLFSGRGREKADLSPTAPPAVQVPPSSSMTTTPLVETPIAKHEEPEMNAVAIPVSAEPRDPPKAEALTDISGGGKETHPTGDAMAKAEERSILDTVEDALRRRDFKRAIEISEKFMARDASPPPRLKVLYSDALLNQAEILSEKDIISSEDLLNRAISVDPKNLNALLLLGKVYTGQKQYGKALETYQEATDLNPEMPGLFFNLGFLYAAEDEYALAEGAFARAIELSPIFGQSVI